MVEFNVSWYKKFIESTNEKNLLVTKIADLLEGKPKDSCLEIGLGISPYFAKKLAKLFNKYTIVEKRLIEEKLPKDIELINNDWEKVRLKEKYDVIIASHVIYYFKSKKKALEKMFKHLKEKGRIFFVVNGKSADYGPIKLFFGKIINEKYRFTYEKLTNLFENKKFKEYTLPSIIRFDSYEDLFETLKLSFDSYPLKYEKSKEEIIRYLKENVKGNKFIIDQKIIEVTK